jgi:hypothetical protein
METTITKKIKGSIMENIFDSDENCNIRYYNAKNCTNYDPDKTYLFQVKIRHDENECAKTLLNNAIKKRLEHGV